MAAVGTFGAVPGTPGFMFLAAVGTFGAVPGTPGLMFLAAVGTFGAVPGTPAKVIDPDSADLFLSLHEMQPRLAMRPQRPGPPLIA